MSALQRATVRLFSSRKLTSFYVAVAHGTRILAALVVIKLIATFVGPEGLAKLGFFMSLASMVAVFAGGGIANAVTKYVAEYHNSPIRLVRFLGAALLYGCGFSISIAVLCAIFATELATIVFSDPALWWMMPIFGIAQVFAFLGVLTIATLNGLGRQDQFAKITFLANLGSIFFSYGLISNLGVAGGALALALTTASAGCVSLYFVVKSRIFPLIRPTYQKTNFQKMYQFSLITASAAILFPVCEILLRLQIVSKLDLETAGLWQGMIRLSGAYIGFFTVLLGASFMPILSATVERSKCQRLVLEEIMKVVSLFILCAVFIYLFREKLLLVVFSPAFLPIGNIIQWQLLGDMFRVASYVIGFLLIAKALTRMYLIAEFVQFSIYLALTSYVLVRGGDLEEVTKIYALTYIIYFMLMFTSLICYTRKSL